MASSAERLRQARIGAGYPSAAEAARAHGWTTPTYSSHENGSRGFRLPEVHAYARAFRVRFEWLSNGAGPMKSGGRVSIRGYIGAGAEVIPDGDGGAGGGLGEIAPPPDMDPSAFIGLRVKGDSMYPVLHDGDIVFYGERTTKPEGQECVVQLLDGRCFIKQVERGSGRGVYNLISYNAPPIADAAIDWAAPVRWIKRK